jgi:hypothetical protein
VHYCACCGNNGVKVPTHLQVIIEIQRPTMIAHFLQSLLPKHKGA